MRLAVISDIHGNLDALDAVLADIDERGVSTILNLGDCLSGPFDAAATANRLIALDLPTVRGNHDRQLVDRPPEKMGLWESWTIGDLAPDHLRWLKQLPLTLELDGVFLCHATPEKDDEDWLDHRGPQHRLVPRDLEGVLARTGGVTASLLLCGHTHTARALRLPSGQLIVNPGSVGCPAYLDSRSDPAFIHQTGSPDARYAILEKRGTTWRADLVTVPYDADGMARMARAKGADSWAEAVTKGWFA